MKYSRSLVATLLMSGGLLQLAPAVLADGTAAGNLIDNTATATYSDGTNTIEATSNKVTVVVAEVAGIDVSAAGIVNKTAPGTAVKVADELYYNYSITNTGNKATQFTIPSKPVATGPGTVTKVEYFNGTDWIEVTATPSTQLTGSVPVNGSIPVRVTILVNNTGTNNNVIELPLGNTPNNLPNQPLLASGNNDDVNTTGGNPANGQRESSATQKTSIGAVVTNIALASVSEKRTGVSDNGTPAFLNDDVLTYELGVKVADTDASNTGITPAPLAGTTIKVDATGSGTVTATRILVSSAIPVGTTFVTGPTNISAPTGWIPVYSTTVGGNANAASWSTTAPTAAQALLNPITRIGFINDPNTLTTVAPGATVAGLTFKVRESGANPGAPAQVGPPILAAIPADTSYTINSMAQLFGSTDSTDTVIKALVVYDESGDTTVNNSTTPTQTAASIGDGIAVAATYGIDSANDNSGTSTDANGEINQYIYNYVAPAAASLLNGPLGIPDATGPNAANVISNNFDFTNKSSTVPSGKKAGDTIDPSAVGFFNTVKNTGTAVATIKLLPEAATLVDTTYDTALPDGTRVKIYTTGTNSQFAIYVVNGTSFTFDSGSAGITATTPVSIPNVGIGGSAEYQVEVDMPSGSPEKAYPLAINAFTDAGAANKTIDRVYTGFVKMTKETRILQGSGPAVKATEGTFGIANKTPAPGNIIEYRISYENISTKLTGTGNAILNATNLVITEDGTTLTNTWGQDKDSNGTIDTSNVVGSAVGSLGSVTRFNGPAGANSSVDQSGTAATTDVTKYINSLTTVVAPGDKGTFTFQRKLN